MMIISKENITSIIPQRDPFIMIDQLMHSDEHGFVTTFEVTQGNLFLQDGKLSESALIENVAQSCAAGFGYLGSQQGDKEPRIGFIGAITKCHAISPAFLGYQLTTKISIIQSFEQIHLVQGEVFHENEKLLACQMKIVLA